MPKQVLEFSSSLGPAAVADYLEALGRGLREGRLTFEAAGEAVELEAGTEITIELTASASDKGKSTISIALEWRAPKRTTEPALTIRAGASSYSTVDMPVEDASDGMQE